MKNNQDIIVTDNTILREIGIPLEGEIIENFGHTVDSISIKQYNYVNHYSILKI